MRQKHKSTNRSTRKLTSCLNQVWNLFHFMILRNCNSIVLCLQLRMSGSWMCAKIIPATTLLTSSASCRRHSSPSVTSPYVVAIMYTFTSIYNDCTCIFTCIRRFSFYALRSVVGESRADGLHVCVPAHCEAPSRNPSRSFHPGNHNGRSHAVRP